VSQGIGLETIPVVITIATALVQLGIVWGVVKQSQDQIKELKKELSLLYQKLDELKEDLNVAAVTIARLEERFQLNRVNKTDQQVR
jgi:chromosome segregation ATPase